MKFSLLSLRTMYGLVGLGIIGAIVGVIVGQIVSAQSTEVELHEQSTEVELHEFEFGADQITFCSDGGPISMSSSEIALGEFGYATATEAVAVFTAQQHSFASNPEIPIELRRMLGPTRETEYTETTYVAPSGQAFFDVVSSGAADLEARIIVKEHPQDGWKVAEVIQCMSVIVSDFQQYSQIAERVYAR